MNPLWLPNLNVTEMKESAEEAEFICSPIQTAEHCPKCGVVDHFYKHGVERVGYQDAPAFGKRVRIRIDVQRYRCRSCGSTFNQSVPHMDGRRQMTSRCVDFIVKNGIDATYSDLARQIGVHEKTVRDICNGHFPALLKEREICAPVILGIDELSLDGKDRRAIFTDVGASRVLDLIETNKRTSVERWLRALPHKDLVHIVTIDMWRAYRDAVHAVLPNAKVVVDKWHVQKPVNEALDKVRNRLRRAGKTPHKNPRHGNGKHLLLKRAHRLTPMRRMLLDGILKNNPVLADAWTAKEAFYDIWDAPTRAEAERRFASWAAKIPASVASEFGAVVKTVENWRTEIFAYFDYHVTNAYTESANRIIKQLNRAGAGYSFASIRAKALLLESPSKTELCVFCKKDYPSSVIKSTPILEEYRGEVIDGLPACGNCLHIFHTYIVSIWPDFIRKMREECTSKSE